MRNLSGSVVSVDFGHCLFHNKSLMEDEFSRFHLLYSLTDSLILEN